MHWCNVADDVPCDMDVGGCELTGACDNQVVSKDVEVMAAEWLCDDKERGQPQKGLITRAQAYWRRAYGLRRSGSFANRPLWHRTTDIPCLFRWESRERVRKAADATGLESW